ncbi:hypothetical protein ACYJ1Y_11540 [Natrialbaceae archaeon A-gly3]
MTGITRRRTLGTIAGVAVLAGCMGGADGDEEAADDDGTESEPTEGDRELTEADIVALFGVILADEGLEVASVDRNEAVLEVAYDATGTTGEDAGTEIGIVADVYARAIDAGLETDSLEASVLDPETGELLDTFLVETEWAEAFLEEESDWEEYFERIVETFDEGNGGDR